MNKEERDELQRHAADSLFSVAKRYNLMRYYNKARSKYHHTTYIVTSLNIEFVFDKILSSANVKKRLMKEKVKHLGFVVMNTFRDHMYNRTLLDFINNNSRRYIFYDAQYCFTFTLLKDDETNSIYLHCYYIDQLVSIHNFISDIMNYFKQHHNIDLIVLIARCSAPECYPKPAVYLVTTLLLAYFAEPRKQFIFTINESVLSLCELYIEDMIYHYTNFIRDSAFMNRLRKMHNNAYDNEYIYDKLKEYKLLKYGTNASIKEIEEKMIRILGELFEVIGAI